MTARKTRIFMSQASLKMATFISMGILIALFSIGLSKEGYGQFVKGEIDQSKFYRITNVGIGAGKCLQINYPDNVEQLIMTDIEDNRTEQHWGILWNGYIDNRTLSYPSPWGGGLHLEGWGIDHIGMDNSGNGAKWAILETATPGIYTIQQVSSFGKTNLLYAKADGKIGLRNSDFPSARSKLWKLEEVVERDFTKQKGISHFIPVLSGGEGVEMSEAGPVVGHYLPSRGHKKGVVLFVDFEGARGVPNPGSASNPIIDFSKADKWSRDRSVNRTRVSYTIHDFHWRQMPRNHHHYSGSFTDKTGHKNFIQDAVNLYDDVDFDKYDFVVVIVPNIPADFPQSVSIDYPKTAAITQGANGSRVRFIITLGSDVYPKPNPRQSRPYPYKILLHELGHLYGLPDLYYDVPNKALYRTDADYSLAGSWGLMSDADRAIRFLGWHKHLLNWNRSEFYLTQGKHTINLTNLGADLAVIPLDDAHHPSKVLVIEPAPIIQSRNKENFLGEGGKGVLIYTVDATRPTQNSPIEVQLPTGIHHQYSEDYGYLSKAHFHGKRKFEYALNGWSVKVWIRYSFNVSHDDPYWSQPVYVLDIEVDAPLPVKDELKKRDDFKTMEVGNTIWMAENLNLDIPGSVCHSNDPANCDKYGRMYTWEQAKQGCKQLGAGWRLASDEDWRQLALRYGGATNDRTITLKDPAGAFNALGPGTEFNGQAGGKKYYFLDKKNSWFYSLGASGHYWTSDSRDQNTVINYTFILNAKQLRRVDITPLSHIYCRCVKDK